MNVVTQTDLSNLKLVGRGKVRDIYDLGSELLIVTTDRISAFDVVFPNGIPHKGEVLTTVSEFWFEKTAHIVKNHLITTDVKKMPAVCLQYKDILKGRSMLVKKAKPFPVECIARGYITGSGWKDYKKTGSICGISLPKGLKESEKFTKTIFTPATKEQVGIHDENISFERMIEVVGKETAEKLKKITIELYEYASKVALKKGIIIADTKFEFGLCDNEIILIDEALTPDSSRFWKESNYKPGSTQNSMDKQVVRDYLETTDWDKTPPAPHLPEEIVNKASKKYREIMSLIVK